MLETKGGLRFSLIYMIHAFKQQLAWTCSEKHPNNRFKEMTYAAFLLFLMDGYTDKNFIFFQCMLHEKKRKKKISVAPALVLIWYL